MNPSPIEWCDTTWNPVTGCSKVSQGCKNCYAERVFPRVYSRDWIKGDDTIGRPREFTDVRTHPERLEQPLRMRKPKRIFVNSMSDLFHEDVPDAFIDQVFAVMGTAKWHTFQVLTKRPERMLKWFSEKWQAPPESTQREQHEVIAKLMVEHGLEAPPPFKHDPVGEDRFDQVYEALSELDCCTNPDKDHLYTTDGQSNLMAAGWPLPNVWLGVSVEDQATADERIPLLLQTPAAVRFISAEPLLGPVNVERATEQSNTPGTIDWVIAGGESGPCARPSHPDWFRSLRNECAAFGVPFFFKQWGEYGPSPDAGLPDHLPSSAGYYFDAPHPPAKVWKFGKKAAGRLLDGREHSELPTCPE